MSKAFTIQATRAAIIHPFAAGIDIDSRFHVAAVSPDSCDESVQISGLYQGPEAHGQLTGRDRNENIRDGTDLRV